MGMGKILWGWEGDEIMGTRWDVENPRESGRDGEKFMEMGGDRRGHFRGQQGFIQDYTSGGVSKNQGIPPLPLPPLSFPFPPLPFP